MPHSSSVMFFGAFITFAFASTAHSVMLWPVSSDALVNLLRGAKPDAHEVVRDDFERSSSQATESEQLQPRTAGEAMLEARRIVGEWNSTADAAEVLFTEANTTGCLFLAEATSALRSMEPLVELLHRSAKQRAVLPFRSWMDTDPEVSAKFMVEVKTALTSAIGELAMGCGRLRESHGQSIARYRAAKTEALQKFETALAKVDGLAFERGVSGDVNLRQQTSVEIWPFTSGLGTPVTKEGEARAALLSANASLPGMVDQLHQLNKTIVSTMVEVVLSSTADVMETYRETCMQSTVYMPTAYLARATEACTNPSQILAPMAQSMQQYMASIDGDMAISLDTICKLRTAIGHVVMALTAGVDGDY